MALLAPNVADFPRAYYGILAAGATVVPVHLLLTADEVGVRAPGQRATSARGHTSQLGRGGAAADAAGIPVVTVGPLPARSPATRLEESRRRRRCRPT